jgi:catechol-2,3-dioxygenase
MTNETNSDIPLDTRVHLRRLQRMLANVPVCATLPTSDLDRATRFYVEALGLAEGPISVEGGVFLIAGGGTMLRIYERPPG